MPIYEYECKTCGEEFEIIQKFSDPPLKKHGCSPKSVVNRLISLNAFQLKGGGWYNEGYAKDNGKSKSGDSGASEKNESSSKGDSEKTASGGESKSAGSESKSKDSGSESKGSTGSGSGKNSGKSAGSESKSSGASPASS